MNTNRISTSLTLHLSFIFLIYSSSNNNLTKASDTILKGQFLSGNHTIVSKGGKFELGFFTPGKSRNYYIGIWFKNLPNQTIIWVANRETPVANPSTSKLAVSNTGNLVLFNSSKAQIWSTNLTQSATKSTASAAAAVLLDTGNLVLTTGLNSKSYFWQSFDHPTDTWMPGGTIRLNKITGEYNSLTSWKSSEDPAPGLFSESFDPNGSNQIFFLWNGTHIYRTTGLWTGQSFTNDPGLKEHNLYNFSFVDGKESKYATYTMLDDSLITRTVLDTSGQSLTWFWLSNSQEWQTVYAQPLKQCDVYSLCGPFGICDEKSSNTCRCSDGFQPLKDREWELNDWSSGCARKSRLQCGDRDGFLKMPNMRLPMNKESSTVGSDKECEAACIRNCLCDAYSYGPDGCSVWKGDLRNLQRLYDGDSGGSTLFIRLLASDIPSSGIEHKKTTSALLIGTVIGAIAILFCAALGLVWTHRRRKRTRALEQLEGSLIRVSYSELRRMTKNFSAKLGSGGFGTVFKGMMSDSTAIAVKKLEGARQGEKQFQTEVSTLGAIQHVNLVRLRGFCSEGNNRLLIYEYMSEGSLDSHLFRDGPTFLNWKTRYQIAIGTARGLAYLHEKCRECIIHCDIKPDNILLDAAFCPKVSDFGMAKLIGRDFSHVLTTMRGTIGYLAPEWISGLPITAKVDVYSFGMMMFELVSGKRNTLHSEDGSLDFYPSWAARQALEGNAMGLLDERLEGDASEEEVDRACKVAIWCIQDSEDHRPSMEKVVQILEGVLEVKTPPLPDVLKNIEKYMEPLYQLQITDQGNPASTSQGLVD